jgi:alkylhydroperoxidase family enzyme
MRVELAPQPQNPIPDLSLQYSPELVRAGSAFGLAPYQHSRLPLRLFEACRIATAVINGCTVCMNWRAQRDLRILGHEGGVIEQADAPDEAMYQAVLSGELDKLTEKERVAVRFSQKMGTDSRALGEDEAFWAELKRLMTDAEIVDLTHCTAAWMAMGRVAHVLGVDSVCTIGGPLAEAA